MSTLLDNDIREKVEETVDDTSDSDGYAHFFKKKDVEKAIFDGKLAKALCGRMSRPMNSVADKETCPTCKEFYELLP